MSLPKMADEMNDFIPPSSAPRIPQSVIRPRAEVSRNPLYSTIHATPTRRSSLAAERSNGMLDVHVANYGASIQATPTRKSSLTSQRPSGPLVGPTENGGAFLPSSPLQQRHSGSSQNYGVVSDSVTRRTSSSLINHQIQETPIKKRLEAMAHSHPAPFASNNKENTKAITEPSTKQRATNTKDDIYKTLGWDDDDDDELA